LLSKAGKEVLIKAIAQAIPTFLMSCFYLTKGFCDELSAMIAKYWWSKQDKENKIHWISWWKMIKPKGQGGLGFRDIHGFNIAMLSRQAWRFIQNPDSLCASILKAKYFPDCHILEAKPCDNMSYTWRSILHGVELVKKGVIWRIGDGEHVNIWQDPWIPRAWCRKILTPRGDNILCKVSDLISPITGQWDEQLVMDTFSAIEARLILNMPLREGAVDFLAWHYDLRGIHSVRNAYKLQMELQMNASGRDYGGSTDQPEFLGGRGKIKWWRIWKLACPNKVKHFWWRCAHNSLATRDNLIRRGVQIEDPKCLFCNHSYEDGCHLFVRCREVKPLWRDLGYENIRLKIQSVGSIEEAMDEIWKLSNEQKMQIVTMWWLWWRERNRVREGEMPLEIVEIVHRVKCISAEFVSCFGKGKYLAKPEEDK
jgi:hypothetical protein